VGGSKGKEKRKSYEKRVPEELRTDGGELVQGQMDVTGRGGGVQRGNRKASGEPGQMVGLPRPEITAKIL